MTEETKIDGHAHAYEEQPEQQTTEGLDIGHDLMTVAGICQEQAAKEGTEGHGQASPLREPCGTEYQQNSGGGKYLGISSASGNELEYGPQEDATQDEDTDNYQHRFQCGQLHVLGDGQLLRREQRQQRNQGYDGQILQE